MLYVLTVLCLSRWALAQIALDGPCPQAELMQDFNFSKYVGMWHEVRRTEPTARRGAFKCIKNNYIIDENGDARSALTIVSRRNNISLTIPGRVRPMDPAEPAKMRTRYTIGKHDVSLQVLGTDYENYAVLYACLNSTWTHLTWIFLETRDQNPTDAVLEPAYNLIDKVGFPKLMLTKIEHTDCEWIAEKPTTG